MTENAFKEINIQGVVDELHTFIVEPFTPHEGREEYYVSFQNHRDGTLVYFHHEGGVHVGDVDRFGLFLHLLRSSCRFHAARLSSTWCPSRPN